MKSKLSPDRQAAQQARELNRIIACQNLYRGGSRYINAQNLCGQVLVENLHTGAMEEYTNDGSFRDGYGHPVVLGGDR